jgi:hypothetical protein
MRNKLLLLGVCLLVGVALASSAWADKITEANEKYWNPKPEGTLTDVAEVEPNGTFATAQPVACGDVVHGSITVGGPAPAGDLDYYVFTTSVANTIITFGTDADGAPEVLDTYIYLYNSAQAQVASNDDGGPGLYSLITYTAVAPGTYYGMVRSYSSAYTGLYKAFFGCAEPQPPPPNDTCAGAIDILCGPVSLSGTTQWATNDYNPAIPGPSCTGFSALGKDVTYKFLVGPGGVINVTYVSTADASIYVVTDCANMASCVVGADAAAGTEVLNYTFATGGTYYLIIDSYGTNTSGTWTLTGTLEGCPVPTENRTWGSVKNLYR